MSGPLRNSEFFRLLPGPVRDLVEFLVLAVWIPARIGSIFLRALLAHLGEKLEGVIHSRKLASGLVPVRIRVTEEDITRGAVHSRNLCPIARAARRGASSPGPGSLRSVAVERDWLWMPSGNAPLPDRASRWLYRFDRGKRVRPFSFRVFLQPNPGASPAGPLHD